MKSLTKSTWNFLKSFQIHPFLLGIFPVLSLYLSNISETNFPASVRSLLFALGMTIVVHLLLRLIIRSSEKAALISSLFLILFFSYGHLYDLSQGFLIGGVRIVRHVTMTGLWLVLLIAASVAIVRSKSTLQNLTKILNLTSLVLVGALLLQIGYYQVRTQGLKNPFTNSSRPAQTQAARPPASPTDRNIYYILIDSYSRQDVLQSVYHVDDSAFISDLTNLGFVVPNCTLSNYDRTALSVTSSLNMNYLDTLGFKLDPTATVSNSAQFAESIHHSLVRSQLESLGYKTVTFKSVNPYIDIDDSDYYYDFFKNNSYLDSLESRNFQDLLFQSTWLRGIFQLQATDPGLYQKIPSQIIQFFDPTASVLQSREFTTYQQDQYALDRLENTYTIPDKIFVYAHLFTTHQPLVYNADGSFRGISPQNGKAYADAAVFVEKRMIQVVKTILDNSNPKPIIIIQGDHSYVEGSKRNRILNAYYLPGVSSATIYAHITPVNTFRTIFNQYFGGNYPLLPDKSFTTGRKFPYLFTPVKPSCVN
jgi:hypothetical protein